MSDADLLRRAAALMRERATDAGEAWGTDKWTAGETGWDDRQGGTYDVQSAGGLVAVAGCEELAEHIASWHPAVALAVATWLDSHADIHALRRRLIVPCPALATARAFLGSDE